MRSTYDVAPASTRSSLPLLFKSSYATIEPNEIPNAAGQGAAFEPSGCTEGPVGPASAEGGTSLFPTGGPLEPPPEPLAELAEAWVHIASAGGAWRICRTNRAGNSDCTGRSSAMLYPWTPCQRTATRVRLAPAPRSRDLF